jgi:hypothetical protein
MPPWPLWRLLFAGALGAATTACTERQSVPVPAYECAARPTVTVWDSTVNDGTPGSFAVASDAGGYVLLWTQDLSLGFVPRAGVYAARPGGAVRSSLRPTAAWATPQRQRAEPPGWPTRERPVEARLRPAVTASLPLVGAAGFEPATSTV